MVDLVAFVCDGAFASVEVGEKQEDVGDQSRSFEGCAYVCGPEGYVKDEPFFRLGRLRHP
ncbi:hypothetical protein ACN28C_09250 [Plantactinospora sp. WMMC1484]|uniref:hypothetical protein n=1 Tax=Plantactinospora sp. WMMC1484 TaxID=3404122 RepID=UPI003BF4F95F